MPADQRALVDRQDSEVQRGYRLLAGSADDPAWRVLGAAGELSLQPQGRAVQLEATARLELQARRETGWIGLEIPDERPNTMDVGGQGFSPGWSLLGVEDPSGAPLTVVVTEAGAAQELAFRPDRRLVYVRWPTPAAAGEARALVVRWRQDAPYAAVESLATSSLEAGEGSPPLHALPLVAGDPGRFPYALTVHAPAHLRIAVSGAAVETTDGPAGVTALARGLAGGAAVVAVGPYEVDQLGAFRALARDPAPGLAESMARLSVPLGRWWGEPLGGLDLVMLAPGWRFPGVVSGEGWVGVRTAVRLKGIWSEQDMGVPDLPGLERVLVAEGMAQAAWASLVGGARQGAAWLDALARASALDQLDPDDALTWRRWLARCSTPLPGARPPLSPEIAATTGFRDMAARCAGPLIVGPMLDDRLGVERAMAVRRGLVPQAAFDAAGLSAAVLAVDPSAGAWVQRWLKEGHSAQITIQLQSQRVAEGWRTTGRILADGELGGAPVRIRLSRGLRRVDVEVPTSGALGIVDVSTPFSPVKLEVDPEQRLLRLPLIPVEWSRAP